GLRHRRGEGRAGGLQYILHLPLVCGNAIQRQIRFQSRIGIAHALRCVVFILNRMTSSLGTESRVWHGAHSGSDDDRTSSPDSSSWNLPCTQLVNYGNHPGSNATIGLANPVIPLDKATSLAGNY